MTRQEQTTGDEGVYVCLKNSLFFTSLRNFGDDACALGAGHVIGCGKAFYVDENTYHGVAALPGHQGRNK